VSVEQDAERLQVPSLLEVPEIKLKGGVLIIGDTLGNLVSYGRIRTDHVSVEQDAERAETELPNIHIAAGGIIEFQPQTDYPEFMIIGKNGSITVQNKAAIHSPNLDIPTISIFEGGSLIDHNSGDSIQGNILVHQDLSEKTKLISSPVESFLTDNFTETNLFSWDENMASWNAETASSELVRMKGYKAETAGIANAIYEGGNFYGAQTVDFTNSTSLTQYERGWNLAGNPYTSSINWENVTFNEIENTIYSYDPVAENFAIYRQGGISLNGGQQTSRIAQGFFLKSFPDALAPTLELNTARVHTTPGLLSSSPTREMAESMLLTVSGNDKSDETLLALSPSYNENYEINSDAYKLFSLNDGVPQLYTLSANAEPLAIHATQYPEFGVQKVIPLNFSSAQSGDYTLTASNISLHPNYSAFLKDLETDEITDLRDITEYTFTHTAGNDIERFELFFNQLVGVDENKTVSSITIYNYGNNAIINLEDIDGAEVELFNIQGTKLQHKSLKSNGIHSIKTPQAQGTYLLKVSSKTEVKIHKIIISE